LKRFLGPRLRTPAFFRITPPTTPLSAHWGFDRGTPVDRFFIERFLERHRAEIRGRVLEIGDDRYTRRYGDHVMVSDVLDLEARPGVTVLGDLSRPKELPVAGYDCLIVTQTLQYVFDLATAVASVSQLLAPGGVGLVTVPAVGRLDSTVGIERDHWRFTPTSLRRLFEAEFQQLEIESHGNVLLAAAFLYGLAAEELKPHALEQNDPLFPVVITMHARKPLHA
jgi:SAM-dependent methyltransferase